MSSAIGPGDFVECVNAEPCALWGDPGLREGGIYQVEAVAMRRDSVSGFEGAAVRLVGYVHPTTEGVRWLGADRFRPIYRPNADLIESLKQPAPDAVRELVAAD